MELIKKYTFFLLIILPLSMFANTNQAQEAVCHTQILVTTPQTVSFYLGPITQDTFVGTGGTGKWLNTYAVCIKDKKVRAIAWDSDGNKHTYKSTQTYNNINNFITVIYPQDFDGAPSVTSSALCQVHLFNNSKALVAVYVKTATANNKITVLKPYQNQIYTSLCFNSEALIARLTYKDKNGRWQNGQRYKSLTKYTDINDIPFVTFPDDFKKTATYNWTWITGDRHDDDSGDSDS